MSGRKLRWLTAGLFASAGAGMLSMAAVMNSAFAFGEVDAAVVDPEGLIIGASGTPIPNAVPGYFPSAFGLYLTNPLNFTGANPLPYGGNPDLTLFPNGINTPEGLYPLTGVKTLPLNYPVGADGYTAGQQTSVAQGETILNQDILQSIQAHGPTSVFGYSQSATIASYEMAQLHATDPTAPVQFVLIGDPSNPDGGLLARFPDLALPSLGVAFGNSTPADDFPTVIYSAEYDGFADFPQYPINFLSDLNAFLGIEDIHGHYLTEFGGPLDIQDAAIPVATSGATDTSYYILPVNDLPLLDPVRGIPVAGNPIADLLQPDLKLIVNLGYDNPNPLEGWSAGPANVQTPFGLFPSFSQVLAALQAVPSQTELGLQNFIGDFTGGGPNPVSLDSLSSLLNFSSGTGGGFDPLTTLSDLASNPGSINDLATNFSAALSTAYGTLLPTADIGNALLTSLPAYDVSLFTENLQAGNLLDAVGLPLAADTAIGTLAAGFEYEVVNSAISAITALF
jgi:hypothetical protein